MITKLKPDHIVYAARDLDRAITHIERLLGIRPLAGGPHPGRGSRNALLPLGEDVYLEVIGFDPDQGEPEQARSFGLDRLEEPRLITWAASTTDLLETVAQARAAGYDPGQIVTGGRVRTDGVRLHWRSVKRAEAIAGDPPPGDWLVPFLIEWGETEHPAASGPSGCTLVELRLEHPDPPVVQSMLDALGIELSVSAAPSAALSAIIDGPNGRVELR